MAHKHPLVSEREGYQLLRTDSQSGYTYVSANGSRWRVDYKKKRSGATFSDPADAAVHVAKYLAALKAGGDTNDEIDTVVAAYSGEDLSTTEGLLRAMSAF